MTDYSDESGEVARDPRPPDEAPTAMARLRLVREIDPGESRSDLLRDAPRAAQRPTPKGKVKASFNLLPEDLDTIRALSEELGTTVTNVLQRAIRDERFVREQIAQGNRFAIVDQKGVTREIIWR